MKTSVALRKLFPRPAFVPDKIEISLEKHVLIDSPETTTYELVNIHKPRFGDAAVFHILSAIIEIHAYSVCNNRL